MYLASDGNATQFEPGPRSRVCVTGTFHVEYGCILGPRSRVCVTPLGSTRSDKRRLYQTNARVTVATPLEHQRQKGSRRRSESGGLRSWETDPAGFGLFRATNSTIHQLQHITRRLHRYHHTTTFIDHHHTAITSPIPPPPSTTTPTSTTTTTSTNMRVGARPPRRPPFVPRT